MGHLLAHMNNSKKIIMICYFFFRRRKKKYESSITDPFLSVPFILFFLHFLLFCLLLFLGWARISKHDSQRIYIDIGARMNYAKKNKKETCVISKKGNAVYWVKTENIHTADLWALFYISFRLEKKKLASSWGSWGNIIDLFIYFSHLFIYLFLKREKNKNIIPIAFWWCLSCQNDDDLLG